MAKPGKLALSLFSELEKSLSIGDPASIDVDTLRAAIDLYGLTILADGEINAIEEKLYTYLLTHGPEAWGPISRHGELVEESRTYVASIKGQGNRAAALKSAGARIHASEAREQVFRDCIMLMLADGVLQVGEATLCNTLRDGLRIPPERVGKLIDSAERRFSEAKENL